MNARLASTSRPRHPARWTCVAVGVLLRSLAAADTPEPGDPRLEACVQCHGTDGRGNRAVGAPRIGGMEDWYIERQLRAFRHGWRGWHPADDAGREMRAIAISLSDEDAIRNAAAWFSTRAVRATPNTVRGNPQTGRVLYAACASCHGSAARGDPAQQAPALAYQDDWYLATQLEHFRRGVRGSDATDVTGARMRAVAAALPDEQAVRDVVAYINSIE